MQMLNRTNCHSVKKTYLKELAFRLVPIFPLTASLMNVQFGGFPIIQTYWTDTGGDDMMLQPVPCFRKLPQKYHCYHH